MNRTMMDGSTNIKFLLLVVPVIKSYSCIIPCEVPDQFGHNVVNFMYTGTSDSPVITADNTRNTCKLHSFLQINTASAL